ncbi:hypothetical protein AXX17_AT5G53380 [Arabidopsis thaliana]|uniref:Uncharacterized protein n=1 Tax=Arabidopsis thaliana TaxID=3702 RepID=A0A178UCA0_ARATH|nr:hypothetical protein AXX17_AT5G53380 [Arabidopsis thaliana]
MESATFVPLNRGYKVNLEIGYEMETAASSPLKTDSVINRFDGDVTSGHVDGKAGNSRFSKPRGFVVDKILIKISLFYFDLYMFQNL